MYRLYLQKAATETDRNGAEWFYLIRGDNIGAGRSVGFFAQQSEVVKSVPLGELENFNEILKANTKIRPLKRSAEKGETPFTEQEMEQLANTLKTEFHFK